MSTTPERADARAELRALRARLSDLTIHDAHRLGRRLETLRGARGGRPLARVADEVAAAEERIARRRAAVPQRIDYPAELPVTARREDLKAAIRDHSVVIVAGETGSGKSTQLPKLCLELGRGVQGTIAHTQPRRLAARTIAERVAEELRVPLGGPVGYAVRFADRSSDETLVRLMTDGLLLAEIQHDRLLRRYDTVIVDEAHERSLNVDFLLGVLKRILPRRPELKLIVTSATIDVERLSEHFDGAPVVEVSGRTYPVELRWRPVADAEHERLDAIPDAVEELLRDGPGDVLVFLSGEREIRDTAELLSGRLRSDVELLPLYARLSHAEQQKVFQGHARRRVVLATNVAETSLTVPGIRAVVDPGTARISRYSARLKVQRLPIEPISRASADQRMGRCGRTADGICIRLYDEDDYAARPRFTDPEILRTSLASVILQMAALDLGDVEDFPFLDPPDPRQVRDGVALLRELGALEPVSASDGARNRLTALGRRLAQLPVDPRFGRMVLEADRLACAEEAIVIAAGLSIQDPRESPAEARQAAAEQHARFRTDPPSDFLAFLELWRYVRTQQKGLTGSQFRKRCKAEFLHVLRIREWQDLVGQLRQAAKAAGVAVNAAPAEPEQIHRALLAGLLSHTGVRDAGAESGPAHPRGGGARGRRPLAEYTGARGARFALSPGSSLARTPPDWAMVAELVETTRLWGHTAARIEPAWIEPVAPPHLLRHSYGEPRWDARRGAAVVDERVTLYGLPIVAGRPVPYARVDPAAARELFLRRALVAGEWEARHAFLAENARRIAEVEALEDRARRRDLLAGEETRFAFFENRVPAEVVSGVEFERWWRDARRREPELLTLPRELLRAGEADVEAAPTEWRDGALSLPLSYKFAPGAADDGVTVHVPLERVGALRADEFSWLVPALRLELVTALIRSLPKELRRSLVPVPDVAASVLAHVRPDREPLLDALGRELERFGVRVPREAWTLDRLPPHLRMRFRVEDERGAAVAEGEDLDALREAVKPRLRERLAAATPALERTGARAWEFGELPRALAPRAGGGLSAFPALVDEGETVGVRLFETAVEQAAAMRAGTRRLLRLTVRSPIPWVVERLDMNAKLALMTSPHGDVGAALDDALTASLDALVASAGGPAWEEAAFARLRDHVAGSLAEETLATTRALVAVLEARREVERRLDALPVAPALQEIRLDVARQLGRLVHPGCATAAGAARLRDVERWLRAAAARLDRLPDHAGSDRDRMRTLHELEAAYEGRLAGWPAGAPKPPELYEVRWLLEELRAAQFAPALGGARVTAKQVRRAIAQAGRAG
ncbi:MAG TPA: ATP-dependent RNA helicase HrpA [Conexibacter sp.]|nr:ATP-dependent RNA helicase HrpA [Conexibacter sp.]